MLMKWHPLLLSALIAAFAPVLSGAQESVEVSVNVAPPELPVYDQPPIPGDGYIWTPGYWAWGDDIQDYYWVPGTWVEAPQPDYLWTPGYWGVAGGLFLWHAGYWGPHVGFYGGVNYGYGYGGNGYEGGYWQGGRLYYNRSVNNVGNVHITNVYNRTVVNNVTVNRVSYNGGNGVHAEPTPEQAAAARDRHIDATPVQRQHQQTALGNPSLRAGENHGRPPIAATPRAGAFTGAGVTGARQSGTQRPRGTLSVVHSQTAGDGGGQPANSGQARQTAAPRAPGEPQQRRQGQPQPEQRQQSEQQRQPVEQRQQQPQRQPQGEQRQGAAEQRRGPEQPHVAPPAAHPSSPRPAEHEEDRERR